MEQTWLKVPKMSHEEWLSWRKQGIGGSDAPAILEVSPWCTPYKKWLEKTSLFEEKENRAMAYGRSTEEDSRREFEDLIQDNFFSINIEKKEIPWLRASLDGINIQGTKAVEIKKANKKDHALAKEGKIPPKYYPQLQHILQILNLPTIYYFSSPADGTEGVIVEVEKDARFIEETLFPKEKEFWERVLSKNAPTLSPKDKNLIL